MFLLVNQVCARAQLILSDSTNDIYIGVFGVRSQITKGVAFLTNDIPIPYDDDLTIMPFCSTGKAAVIVPLEKSIFIKFQMKDALGREIEKTAEGKEWGSDIKHFPSQPTRSDHDRMSRLEALGSHTNGMTSFASGPLLPKPKDLFVIKDSGIYYLSMEVHLMKQHMNSNGWTWDHIAIPPVTIKVEKP
jgi:hypothetical protein